MRMQTLPDCLYTAAQVRELDRLAIEEYRIPGIELMRRAGAAAFEQIRLRWPATVRLHIFCGAGNNAGDGYVIARLAMQNGLQVAVNALTDPERLRGDALTACQEFIGAGGKVGRFSDLPLAPPCVVVDALLGTGLDREVSGVFAAAIARINASDCPVLAVDIPSGLNADTGQVMGSAVLADCSVCFIALKQGLFTGQAADHCGTIIYADLQVPCELETRLQHSARLLDKPSLPARRRSAHKGHFGHVLLVGGDHGYSGAIRLAAEAALRCGAGLVSVATRGSHSAAITNGRPEIMSHAVESADQLEPLLDRASLVVIGPGLGQGRWSQTLYDRVMSSNKPCVADADALNLLARHPGVMAHRVITPHPGEAARLLGVSTADIAEDRFAAVRALQSRFGGVALLKGAGTLIKGADDLLVSTTGNPGMASGGMGDVLAGMIGALWGQGLSAETAVRLAVYTHGEAADAAAVAGERGLLASDLLPHVRRLLN